VSRTFVSVASAQAGSRTGHLPKTSLDGYSWTHVLGWCGYSV